MSLLQQLALKFDQAMDDYSHGKLTAVELNLVVAELNQEIAKQMAREVTDTYALLHSRL